MSLTLYQLVLFKRIATKQELHVRHLQSHMLLLVTKVRMSMHRALVHKKKEAKETSQGLMR